MNAHETSPTAADTPDTDDTDRPRGPLHHLWQVVSFLLLIATFGILTITILVPKVAGAQPYTVLTGSMQPELSPGSLIVVRPVDPAQIEVGQVITYQLESGRPGVVTHRVVEITENEAGELRFITQGDDNNAVDDEPVRPVQVRGTVWYSIPYLGHVNTWFTGQRRTITVFVLAGLLFAYAAREFYVDHRESRDDDLDDDEPNDGDPNDETPTAPLTTIGSGGGF